MARPRTGAGAIGQRADRFRWSASLSVARPIASIRSRRPLSEGRSLRCDPGGGRARAGRFHRRPRRLVRGGWHSFVPAGGRPEDEALRPPAGGFRLFPPAVVRRTRPSVRRRVAFVCSRRRSREGRSLPSEAQAARPRRVAFVCSRRRSSEGGGPRPRRVAFVCARRRSFQAGGPRPRRVAFVCARRRSSQAGGPRPRRVAFVCARRRSSQGGRRALSGAPRVARPPLRPSARPGTRPACAPPLRPRRPWGCSRCRRGARRSGRSTPPGRPSAPSAG